MGNLSRKIEILGKNQKKRTRGQKHCNRDEDTTKERKVDLHETFKGICPIFVLERQKQRSRGHRDRLQGRILIFTLSKSKLEKCTQISDLFD